MPHRSSAYATVKTRLVQLEANEVLLDCPTEMEAVAEPNETNGNATFAGRATRDQCCRDIAIFLRQSKLNQTSHDKFLQETSVLLEPAAAMASAGGEMV